MTSRERVKKAVNHEVPDRVPLDLGSTSVTGIQASTYAKLRKALGLRDEPMKIIDPFQMLAEVEKVVSHQYFLRYLRGIHFVSPPQRPDRQSRPSLRSGKSGLLPLEELFISEGIVGDNSNSINY